jgi:hypothetical protein
MADVATKAKGAFVALKPHKRAKKALQFFKRILGYRMLLKLGGSYRHLKRAGIINYFEGYPPHAIGPQYADLWGIYLLVMERKPDVLLELGGGYSTFVFAHAARELATKCGVKIKFFSVDESDFWQQVVKDHFPKQLLSYVHFHRSDPEVREIEGERVSVFRNLPVDACNLVYVDGGLLPGAKTGADALLLERKAPSDYAILIDNRQSTVGFLKRALKGRYDVGPGLNGVQTLFVRCV